MPDSTAVHTGDSLALQTHPAATDAPWPEAVVRDTTARWIPLNDGSDSLSMARLDSVAGSVQPDPTGRLDGIAPEKLTGLPWQSPLIPAILVALFVGSGCNASGLRHTISRFRLDLWSVRERRNAFDDDTGTGLGVMRMFLTAGAVIVCGICCSLASGAITTAAILTGIAVTAAFFIFEYCTRQITGYAFASREARVRWVSGYTASVALTGIILFVPALLLLYFPEWTGWLSVTCTAVFLTFRSAFIYKGFRIFFDGISSLLYFILYLCTLEIIPLLAFREIFPALINTGL